MQTGRFPNEFHTVKKPLLRSSLLLLYVQRLFLVFCLSHSLSCGFSYSFGERRFHLTSWGKKGHGLLITLLHSDMCEHDHPLASKVSNLIGEKILNRVSVD